MTGFGTPIGLGQIRDGDRIDLVATDDEREAVRIRLGLAGLDRFEAHATLKRDGDTVRASGRIQASVTQSCVVTGEPIAALVDEPFDLAFVPAPSGNQAEDEIELAEDECDTVFHDGAAIDLGGAMADTLALSVDPYPRSATADAALKEAGIMTEEEASPFAVLAQLKRGGGGE